MKKLSFILAMMFAASLAMAQTNSSNVNQTGASNEATIEQIGKLNQSDVTQKAFGTVNGVKVFATADIYQKGEENKNILNMQDAFYGFSSVDVDQIGNKNEVRLSTQNGGGSAIVYMEGNENKLKGLATLDLFANQKNVNNFDLHIFGSNNTVGMSQEFGIADIDITGSRNGISVRQFASVVSDIATESYEADIDINGSDNTISVDQANMPSGGTGGVNNYAKIELLNNSCFNTVTVSQWGSNHSSTTTINGNSNTSTVTQREY